jgi:hypothetical protein
MRTIYILIRVQGTGKEFLSQWQATGKLTPFFKFTVLYPGSRSIQPGSNQFEHLSRYDLLAMTAATVIALFTSLADPLLFYTDTAHGSKEKLRLKKKTIAF